MEALSNGNVRRETKASFVLAQGDASTAEIMRRAKAKGISLSVQHIYGVRAAAKKRGVRRSARQRVRSQDASVELFLECVLDLGIERSAQLLERIRIAAKNVGTTN